MEYTEIVNLIGSVGFPVAACIYMMVVNNKAVKENTAVTQKLVILIEHFLGLKSNE